MTRQEKITILKDIIDGEIINPSVRKEVGNWAIRTLEQEPKTGEWIKMPICFKCSNCNELEDRTTKYCPNCGARMDLQSVIPQEPKMGYWTDIDEKSAVCSCCYRNNTLYGNFCKWCGARIVKPQEREDNE